MFLTRLQNRWSLSRQIKSIYAIGEQGWNRGGGGKTYTLTFRIKTSWASFSHDSNQLEQKGRRHKWVIHDPAK